MRWLALALGLTATQVLAETPVAGPFTAQATGKGITLARYQSPLDIYPHRIMGRIVEKDTLYVWNDRETTSYELSLSQANPAHVFEDIAPHIGDLDGDGLNDVTVIETSLTRGASLAVYSVKSGRLEKIAQTPYIGQRNRWFAQVGIGDFNQDGQQDVAFVDRPHLARVVRVYSFIDGTFQEIAAAKGVTNHAIGDEVIWGGVRRCNGRDEMVLRDVASGKFITLWIDPTSEKIAGEKQALTATIANSDRALTCR